VAITLITPHQRPSSGGVYTIHQFARLAAALTDVHLVVAKGHPQPVEGVYVHGPEVLDDLDLPEADALVIPADMSGAERLFELESRHGAPILLFQGYGTPGDPVVRTNLALASHALCLSTWLFDQARAAGRSATLLRCGLDRAIFTPGDPTDARSPIVAMMTHPLESKGTTDGLEALRLARGDATEIELQLFGKARPEIEDVEFLAVPNELSEVAALLRASAVFVCASWEEGLGLPGIEAIASGAALATTDTKGSRDYARHGRTALVTEPRDPAALARSIVDLIRDPDLRGRLTAGGRAHVDAIYPEWERAAESFVEAVEDASAAFVRRRRRRVAAQSQPSGEDRPDSIAVAAPGREAHRARQMLREAEIERNSLEDELGRRVQESSDARRRAREVHAELELERDYHEQTRIELAALQARRAPVMARLAETEEHLASLTDAARSSERELAETGEQLGAAQEALQEQERRLAEAVAAQRQSEFELRQVGDSLRAELNDARAQTNATQLAKSAVQRELAETGEQLRVAEETLQGQVGRLADALAAQHQSEVEVRQVGDSLRAELNDARTQTHAAQLAESAANRELTETGSELELSTAQVSRLESALACALADAQVAESERAAFERQTVELSAQLEGIADHDAAPAQTTPDGIEPVDPVAEVHRLPRAVDTWPALPESERQGQQTFLSEYDELVSELPPRDDGADPLALPLAADLRGMVTPAAQDGAMNTPSVDVVVCVHNALEDVRMCVWSLLHKASRPFHLIIVNDGSDDTTTSFLDDLARRVPALTLIHRSDPPHGYTIAANLGLRASTADYVVMLNSDTVVTYGWLERIVAYGEQHERVGILGPMSNAASHQSVPERRSGGSWSTNPLPGWLTADGMAVVLQRAAPRTETRLPFLNGFCLTIKRTVIDDVGEFDEERFASGYAEESDYAQRVRAAGFELAVVDDAYVYHAKSRSYGTAGRNEVSKQAYQTLLAKHGKDEIDRLVREMEAGTMLEPVRVAVAQTISSPEATAAALAQDDGDRLSVVFVLPGLGDGGSGGSHSVYQEVHGLRRLGVPARIALHADAWDRAAAAYADADAVFETYEDTDDLALRTADANVIVATHFKSVATVAAVRGQRDDFLPAYYVQDYEPMFTFADLADKQEAAASYTAIGDALLFAKTHWLCNVVSRRHEVFVAKVEPSIDDELYRPPASRPDSGPVRIAAMVRPRTPRRQPYSTTAVLERLLDRFSGEVEVTTFGCRRAELAKVTRSSGLHASHRGLLKREEVASLLGSSDLFLDMSSYQAFGRTALEAMACGATAVVPRLGGLSDFARNGENLLTVDTMDRDATFEAVAALVDDRQRLAALKAGARETASRYSILRAALSEYIVLRDAYQRRLTRTAVS
jgi:glycosyltransferase involved in cell wall biosynthesis/GT2 family glycosyltransferase